MLDFFAFGGFVAFGSLPLKLELREGLFGFTAERTVGSLTLVRALGMLAPRLVVRRIGFRTLSPRAGRLDDALRPLVLGCGEDRPMLTLAFLRPVDELDRTLDLVVVEPSDEVSELRCD